MFSYLKLSSYSRDGVISFDSDFFTLNSSNIHQRFTVKVITNSLKVYGMFQISLNVGCYDTSGVALSFKTKNLPPGTTTLISNDDPIGYSINLTFNRSKG